MQTELGGFLDDYREIGFLAVELPLIGSFDKGIIYVCESGYIFGMLLFQ